jgi:hypothetical protein
MTDIEKYQNRLKLNFSKPVMPSDGSLVCPAIEKNLLPHVIYKMVQNNRQPH